MKIRMITFHTPINYGAVLQAYALQTYLKSQGNDDVKMIDYKTDGLIKKYNHFKPNTSIRNIIGNTVKLKDYGKYLKRKKKFSEFSQKYFDLTERVIDEKGLEKEAKDADFVFTGSDQVFNPTRKHQEEIDTFYLSFNVGNAKRVAYAPSFGVSSIPIGKRQMVKEYLEKFDYLSVRELNAKKMVSDLVGKEPLCVVDPVLLLSENDWSKIEKKVNVPDNYLLCYNLYSSELEKETVKKIADEKNLKVISITPNILQNIKSDKCFKDVGPEEFIYLLRHAQYVVTDSFHGVVFSTLFKKDFNLTVVVEETKSRMLSYLDRIGLADRVCIDSNNINFDDINYNTIDKNLQREIELSKKYIEYALEGKNADELKNVSNKSKLETITDIRDKCTGCGACLNVCPTNAIEMKVSAEGFEVPVIDEEKCIKCGKCLRVCHALEFPKAMSQNIEEAYYGRIKDNEEVLNYSSSGGIYYLLAKNVIDNGGITYGAVLNKENWEVTHMSNAESSLKAQMKSKYVQSSTYKSFKKIEEDLKQNKKVLFCGTPCQVAGLKKLIGENENLITVDFICHGVPSPQILKDKVSKMEKTYNSKVKKMYFRSKYGNWSTQKILIEFENKKIYFMDANNDDYFNLFLNNFILRQSCYHCHYSNEKHVADITLADYWGVKRFSPKENDEKGLSLILINTRNGQELLETIKNKVDIKSLELEKARYVYKNHDNYSEGKRTIFFREYQKNGYESAMNKLKPKYKLRTRVIKSIKRHQYKKMARKIERSGGIK